MKLRNLVVSVAFAIACCLSFVSLASAHTASVVSPTTKSIQQTRQPHTHLRPNIVYTQCNNTHYLELTYQNGNVCFQNDGYIGLGSNGGNLSNVRHLHSGNNNGWILYYDSNGSHKFYFYAISEYNFNNVYVTQVDITSQS